MSPWELEYRRWLCYQRYAKLWAGSVGWSAVLPWVHFAKKCVLRPIRALEFALRDPVRHFDHHQRRRSRVNHLFGEAYPEMCAPRTSGGRLGTLEDRARQARVVLPHPGGSHRVWVSWRAAVQKEQRRQKGGTLSSDMSSGSHVHGSAAWAHFAAGAP